MKIVTSIVIYAAPIWDGAMNKRSYRIGIESAYRRSTLRVISAFRTVLTDAGMMSLRTCRGVVVEKNRSFEPCSISGECYGQMAGGLSQFLQGKMDLQAHTKHKRMDQKKTGEFLPEIVVNRPWML